VDDPAARGVLCDLRPDRAADPPTTAVRPAAGPRDPSAGHQLDGPVELHRAVAVRTVRRPAVPVAQREVPRPVAERHRLHRRAAPRRAPGC
jgi:hypothetical protein